MSGFTILRHAGALGYPFIQSIQSVLPLVDEFIVAIADDDAETASAVEALNDTRITIVRTAWHPVGIGGVELARQTNIALGQCTGTWAIYAQADELIHEDDYDAIRRAMRAHLTRDTEGLLFDYRHFYRSFRWIADDWRGFYPCAVRVVRTGIGIESAGDAAGFVRRQGHTTRGLIKSSSGARIFHYGWAGSPESRLARAHVVGPMFDGRPSTLTMAELFPPDQTLAVRPYAGTHPSPIKPIVAAAADAFAPPTITSSPAWLRAWSAALRDPQSARGWARVLLPTAFTNARWRLIDRVRDVRQRRANARRAAFYRPFISPSDLVFDVGANLGTHSVCFRALGARVVAFEPQPHCAQVLAATFAGDARVTLVQAAVSDQEGVADLHMGDSHPLSTLSQQWMDRTHRSGRFSQDWHRHEQVACTTLDKSIETFGVPAFIKIDVEGHELHVLRGLSHPIAHLSLEFAAESIDDVAECVDRLQSLATYEFRLSFGDSLAFATDAWAEAASIKAQLEGARLADPLTWGDLYARRIR